MPRRFPIAGLLRNFFPKKCLAPPGFTQFSFILFTRLAILIVFQRLTAEID